MRVWKWVGLAGVVGVAATTAAVVVARRRRDWVDLDDVELRDRLRRRLAEGRAELDDD